MTDDEADWISIASGYLPEGYVIVPVEPTEAMIETRESVMTFEEWYTEFNSCCPLDITKEEVALRAWRAGWAEGLHEGYDVGYDDSGICPECLSEVQHKMDCGRGR